MLFSQNKKYDTWFYAEKQNHIDQEKNDVQEQVIID